MNILLFVEANQRASIAIIRSFKKTNLKILLGISSNKISSNLFLKYFLNLKNFKVVKIDIISKESFIHSLINITNVDEKLFFLPTSEKLLRWCLESKDILKYNKVLLPTDDIHKYEILSNKQSFVEIVQKYNIDVPIQLNFVPTEFLEPFVIKPSFCDPSNPQILSTPILIEKKRHFSDLQKLKINKNLHFAQKYINGPSFYYCAHYNNGKISLNFSQQTILQEPDGGSVVIAIPSKLPDDLIKKIDLLMFDLEWNGVMMIEFKFQDNKWYAIECNPRLWGPLQLSLDNGVNFSLELIKNYFDIESSNNNIKVDKYNYVWLSGFINALILRIIKGKKIQFYRPVYLKKINYKFKDIWLRSDTVIYFFIELFFILFPKRIKNIIKLLFK
jgi:hypothetical protein